MGSLLPVQRTKFTRNEDIQKQWILVDAEGQTLGRIASQIAFRLRGKHRPDYSTHQDIGDYVVIINAGKIKVSGKKMDQKKYYEHSLYPGGLKTYTLREKMAREPIYAIKKAVKRMLPSGPLGRKLLGNLKVYAEDKHEHASQKPTVWEPTYK